MLYRNVCNKIEQEMGFLIQTDCAEDVHNIFFWFHFLLCETIDSTWHESEICVEVFQFHESIFSLMCTVFYMIEQ